MLFYSGFGREQVYTGCCFIQGLVQTGLYRILFYSGFGLEKVYTGYCFIQGLVQRRFIQYSVLFRVWFREALYRMLFYSGFGLDRFIQDAVLFRVYLDRFSLYHAIFHTYHLYSNDPPLQVYQNVMDLEVCQVLLCAPHNHLHLINMRITLL